MRVGVVVSWVHNVTDILSNFCRGSSQTTCSTLSLVTFVVTFTFWGYFRNYALTVVTYTCWTMASYPPELEAYYYLHYALSLFLTLLCLMHVYWVGLMIKIFFNYSKTGSNENLQQKDKLNFKQHKVAD